MQRGRRSFHDAALGFWPLLLAVVLCWPLLSRPGYPLARDLVFVPRQPWTDSVLGLGDTAPRAVPLDAIVSVFTQMVDGGVLARLVIPLVLATAGWGVLRMLHGAGVAGRLAASGLAVWNPYVVERLALGQWALLAGYAALPWLVAAAMRYRDHGRARDLGSATLWTALASLTPTGGLLAVAGLLAGGVSRSRRWVALVGAGVALQAPWLVAAVAGTAAGTSDPAAVEVFAPDTDGPGGPVTALLGLGGIWDDASEPATRGTWLALVAAVVTVVVVVAGMLRLRELIGRSALTRWGWLAAAGALLAVGSATPWGQDLLRWAVATVPGAGLLRDTQKLMTPAVVLCAASLGAVTDRLSEAWRDREQELRLSGLLPLVALPLLLLPDATTVTWQTVDPVDYPDDFDTVAEALAADDDPTVVALPWRSYRLFDWGNGQTSSDPAVRWFDADVLVSDDLQVGDVLVEGESRRAAEVGAALESGTPAEVLGPLGVSWVVVYPDDPGADQLDLAGLEPVHLGDAVQLYRVPGPVAELEPVTPGRRVLVMAGWVVGLAALLVGVVASFRRRGTRSVVSAR